ncbi:MAG: anthranilate synthase component I family protein, partial [Saprospiraceae bacterium]|nr:anthranilate synthase component I family protein [Saprospiraceae bacterium]
MLCASPERFLRKRNDVLISQPIKGTRSRGLTPQEDEALKQDLMNSQKDRSEHVMIVDLVRNDLARSSLTGSVQVSELYGIYSFAQVHQMISTIQSRLRPDIPLVEAIRNAFPMGSMTGAPKIKAMELIDQLESTKRSIYSGAIGYISPEGDFDFNVVIRTLFLRQDVGYLSFSVGGAIVYDSDPEQEYQECMWKAKAILETLGQQPSDIIYQDKGSVTP